MLQVLENFMGYSNQKTEKKNFKPFWKSKNHVWNGILGVDNYDVVHSKLKNN